MADLGAIMERGRAVQSDTPDEILAAPATSQVVEAT